MTTGYNIQGTGSPEGAIAAAVGATYINTTTGSVWTKRVGTGNTGWDLLAGQFNVKDFGALGDGVTQDSTAIQAAITAAAAQTNGGTIFFPPGVYDLTATSLLIPRIGLQDVQTITTTGTPSGGTFTMTFGGQTTTALNYNATAFQVGQALNGLYAIKAIGGVQVFGGAGGPLPTGINVRFNYPGVRSLLTTTDSLTGGTSPATVITRAQTGTGDSDRWKLRFVGSGRGSTILKLGGTGNGRRAFDLNRLADHDTFGNVEMTDFTVDCNNNAGTHHTVVGTMQDGSMQARVNIKDFTVRRVQVINVPVDRTLPYGRSGVFFSTWHGNANEATQGFIRNVLCEDVNVQGGNRGFACIGVCPVFGSQANIFIDNIRYIRCTHSCLIPQTNPAGQTHFHCGSQGFGGRFYAEDCYGYGSADTGFDIDSMTEAQMVGCDIDDCANVPYYFPNFNYPGRDLGGQPATSSFNTVAQQRYIVERCRANSMTATMVTAGGAFVAESPSNYGSIPLGTLVIRDSAYHRETSGSSWDGEAVSFKGTMKGAVINGLRITAPNVTPNASFPTNLIKTVSGAGPTALTRHSVVFDYAGTFTKGGDVFAAPPTSPGFNTVKISQAQAGWLPSGAVGQTWGRVAYVGTGSLTLTSGTLYLVGGIVLPAGQTVSSISFCSNTTAAVSPTNQWFALVRCSDDAILGKTVDDTTTAWAVTSIKTLNLSATYTPTTDEQVWVAICQVAATPATLLVSAGMPTFPIRDLNPTVSATANTGLTNPASFTSLGAKTNLNSGVAYAYVS